ncbi:MAG: cysteine desulfurase [Verrucomicrobia bacterium]|nr:cysteine desulfurase [Verrucomicrobiota bacterium]
MKNVRDDFPILKEGLIYLDSAATSHKPQCVIDAITHFYTHEYATVHRSVYKLAASATEKYNGVREKLAHFLHASSPNEIIFTRGTTDSINLVAAAFPFHKGDEIIISEMEHHSNIVPWQLLCERVGTVLKIIPINDKAELDLEAYKKLLSPKTKLVAVAHIANSTGTINPIETIIQMAHAHGAKVLIDAAQSAAHLSLDVQKLDVDFLAFSGHKAFGPTGIGVLYGKYELLEQMHPVQGGGDMIETVTLEKTTFAKPPLRFEAGTPMIAQVMGLGAAIDYIQKLGLENIARWEHELLVYATAKIEEIPGLRIIGTAGNKVGIISFIIEGVHHLDLAVFLDLEGIAIRSGHHCAQPLMKRFGIPGTCRISFAPFNTKEEVDVLIEVLNRTVAVLL